MPLMSDTPERRRQIEAFARLDDIMALEARCRAPKPPPSFSMLRNGRRADDTAVNRLLAALRYQVPSHPASESHA